MVVNTVIDEDTVKSVDFTLEDEREANVFFVIYEGDKMTFADKFKYEEGGIYTLDINKAVSSNAEVKIFIWDYTTQEPLCKAVKLK